MKLDYLVSRIEASENGGPYVYITFSNPNEFKSGAERAPPFNPFGPNMMSFTSPMGVEDLSNLQKLYGRI